MILGMQNMGSSISNVPHRCNVTIQEAIDIQLWLRARVRIEHVPVKLSTIGIIHIDSAPPCSWPDIATCTITTCSYPSLDVLVSTTRSSTTLYMYDPDTIAFRYLPMVIGALDDIEYDLLLVNSSGASHVRRLGVASHIGVIVNKPTIGVTTSLESCSSIHDNDIVMDSEVIEWSKEATNMAKRLKLQVPYTTKVYDNIVGRAVKHNGTVYYVSPGHMITVQKAAEIVSYICKKSPIIMETYL